MKVRFVVSELHVAVDRLAEIDTQLTRTGSLQPPGQRVIAFRYRADPRALGQRRGPGRSRLWIADAGAGRGGWLVAESDEGEVVGEGG